MRNLHSDLWSKNLIQFWPWDWAWNWLNWENLSYKSIMFSKYLLLFLIFKFLGLQGKPRKKKVAVFLGRNVVVYHGHDDEHSQGHSNSGPVLQKVFRKFCGSNWDIYTVFKHFVDLYLELHYFKAVSRKKHSLWSSLSFTFSWINFRYF